MADGNYIRAEGLKDRPIYFGPWLVCGVALQCFRCLTILQIEADAKPLAVRWVWRVFEDKVRLVQTEGIAANIVRAKKICAADGGIKVVFIIAAERPFTIAMPIYPTISSP